MVAVVADFGLATKIPNPLYVNCILKISLSVKICLLVVYICNKE